MTVLQFINSHIDLLLLILNFVIGAILTPNVKTWISAHLGEKRASVIEGAIKSGLAAAIAEKTAGKSSSETIKSVLNDAAVRNAVVDSASDYVKTVIPTVLTKMGVTDQVQMIVNARVEAAVADIAKKYTIANEAIAQANVVEAQTGAQGQTVTAPV